MNSKLNLPESSQNIALRLLCIGLACVTFAGGAHWMKVCHLPSRARAIPSRPSLLPIEVISI
jgi:hypothetical protein